MAQSDLEARARRAYEWGRFRRALRFAVYPVPLLLIAESTCGVSLSTCIAGALLLVAAIAFAWRGEAYESALVPGFFAGLGAYVVPLVGERIGIFEGGPLPCIGTCLVGGAMTGVVLAARTLKEQHPVRFLASGCTIAALVGSIGCVLAGFAGVLGMVVGVTLGSVPVVGILRLRRAT
jgi:hypothetical protein